MIMSDIIDSPPPFIKTDNQYNYYNSVYTLLIDNGVPLKSQDKYALGMLAYNLAMIDYCSDSIETDGLMMDKQGDRHIIAKKNPAIEMQKEAQTAVRHYFTQFQMSPNSRGSVLNPGIGPSKGAAKSESVLDQV